MAELGNSSPDIRPPSPETVLPPALEAPEQRDAAAEAAERDERRRDLETREAAERSEDERRAEERMDEATEGGDAEDALAARATPEQPKKLTERLAEGAGNALSKIMEFLGKAGEAIKNAWDKMSIGGKRGLMKLGQMIPALSFLNEWARPAVEVADIQEKMTEKLGKAVESENDQDLLKKLHEQHAFVLSSSNGTLNAGNYSFDTFIEQKIDALKEKGVAEGSLQLLLTVNTPEQQKKIDDGKKAEEQKEGEKKEGEEQKAEEEKQEERREVMKNSQEAKSAAYVAAFGRAMMNMGVSLSTYDQAELDKDMTGKREDPYRYKELAKEIQKWLETENNGEGVFGIEVDGGVLEEADGSNWFYDSNLMQNFDLVNSPISTIDRFLKEIEMGETNELKDGTDVNKTAYTQLPELQRQLRLELAKNLGQANAPEPVENAASDTE